MIRIPMSRKMIVAQRMKIQIANQAAMNRMMIQAMMKKMSRTQMIHLKKNDLFSQKRSRQCLLHFFNYFSVIVIIECLYQFQIFFT